MEPALVFGVISGLLVLTAYATYMVDILRGNTKPEQWSFFVWFVLSIVFFLSLFAEGIGWAAVYPAAGVVGAGVIWCLSIKHGYGTLDRFHMHALFLAGLAIVGWAITTEPIVAILLAIVADFSGLVLTWRKTARYPQTESVVAWSLGVLAALFALMSVPEASFEVVLFPIYYLFVNASVVLIVKSERTQRLLFSV